MIKSIYLRGKIPLGHIPSTAISANVYCLQVVHVYSIAIIKGCFLFVLSLTCHDPATVSNLLPFGFMKCSTKFKSL